MFLLKFKLHGKEYLLHNGEGESFVGAMTEDTAHVISSQNVGKAIGVGGFEIVEVKDSEELSNMIGGVPYSIISVSGGLGVYYSAVEIKQ